MVAVELHVREHVHPFPVADGDVPGAERVGVEVIHAGVGLPGPRFDAPEQVFDILGVHPVADLFPAVRADDAEEGRSVVPVARVRVLPRGQVTHARDPPDGAGLRLGVDARQEDAALVELHATDVHRHEFRLPHSGVREDRDDGTVTEIPAGVRHELDVVFVDAEGFFLRLPNFQTREEVIAIVVPTLDKPVVLFQDRVRGIVRGSGPGFLEYLAIPHDDAFLEEC